MVLNSVTHRLKSICLTLIFGFIFFAGSVNAEEIVMNGATCVPYPPYGDRNNGTTPVDHYLYASKGSANCHFTLHQDTKPEDLFFVLVDGGTSGSGVVKLSLCTYQFGSQETSCGLEQTLQGERTIVNLYPAVDTNDPVGMFVKINFPEGDISIIRTIIAHFFPL